MNTYFHEYYKVSSLYGMQELAEEMNTLVITCYVLTHCGHVMVHQTVGMDLMKPSHFVVSIHYLPCGIDDRNINFCL